LCTEEENTESENTKTPNIGWKLSKEAKQNNRRNQRKEQRGQKEKEMQGGFSRKPNNKIFNF